MISERWARVEEIFSRAVDLPEPERALFVEQSCGDDEELRQEILTLLRAHSRNSGVLDADRPWLDVPADDPLPGPMGPYRILRLIGHGGMGRVYLAQREAPGFSQTVALKLMRRGLDTDELIARFRNERQILANLNHPNIARLLDVGASEDGLPYFVMEHVEGVPILEYCDQARLPIAQRLRLFQAVCDAVQYAHRNLVVHRDIKPQNILVTAEGTPKLLDFGIAKILQPDQSQAAPLTRGDVRVLTPEYCAPEQLRGEPVTTACDVYALGVLLYEMLVDRHPYASGALTAAELEQRVLQVDPPPPSAAAPQLRRVLHGDLDRITLKALHKEPEERYSSALSLSEDIERHLTGMPVLARPATARYRVSRFMARNRILVGAAAALFLVLASSTALTLYQSARIRSESARVARERDKALEVRSFLLEMFGATGADQATGDTVTARQILDRRAETLSTAYASDPETHAEMLSVLAEGYEKLGLVERAEPLAREALALRRRFLRSSEPDLVQSLTVLGWVLREKGELEEAESLLREAVTLGRRAFPKDGDVRLARALNDLGAVRDVRGAYDEAAELFRESLDMRLRLLGEEHVGVAITSSNLAVSLFRGGDMDGAVAAGEAALERFQRILGPDHQRTTIVETNLAAMHTYRGDHDAAARMHREILERRKRLFGARHASVAVSMVMLANVLVTRNELAEAEALASEALAIRRERSARPDDIASGHRVLGSIKARAGRHSEALHEYEAALTVLRRTVGEAHEEVGGTLALAAASHAALGDQARAQRAYREAAAVYARSLGANHARTIEVRLALVELLLRSGRSGDAAVPLADAERGIEASGLPADHPLRRQAEATRAVLATR